jgi:hypothetical protein
MTSLNPFSFYLSHEEFPIEFNFNLAETNLVNIILVAIFLIYSYFRFILPDLQVTENNIRDQLTNLKTELKISTLYLSSLYQNIQRDSAFFAHRRNTIRETNKKILEKNLVLLEKTWNLSIDKASDYLFQQEKETFLKVKQYIILALVGRLLKKYTKLSRKKRSILINEIFKEKIKGKV